MSGENFNNPTVKLRALIAPLDWGLGHATRCIPIIKELIANGLEVYIAASGATEELLRAEFPGLKYLTIAGYNISYSHNKKWLLFKILGQLPKINNRIRFENRWLKRCVIENRIDLIIADNRLGLYHESVPCIYITHQLNIKTGNGLSSWIANKIHYSYINKFSECWVPDAEEKINLAGALSHPKSLPKVPVKYLGPLSRFEKKIEPEKKYDLLIILSGPEPQRTLFEEKLLNDLENFKGSILFVRGLSNNSLLKSINNSAIQQFNHLPAEELNMVIQQSKLVICRSGYTSVMDLVKLKQKAVLVPTPGQTEQEYLADYLMEQKLFYCVEQQDFDLNKILSAVKNFSFAQITIEEKYKAIIKKYLLSVNK